MPRSVPLRQERHLESMGPSEAQKTLDDMRRPIYERIEAARVLGFAVTYRGPAERPRRIIFWRHDGQRGTERKIIVLPKGKNARKGMGLSTLFA